MRKHLKHLKNEKGLTLVELLVVIVILGIVAAIAVVAVGNIVEKSREKATVSEAVQILNAAKLMYTSEGSAAGEYNQDKLKPYLDAVKADKFTVTLAKDTAGNMTFKIKEHPVNDLGTVNGQAITKAGATLDELSKALNNDQ